MSTKYASGHRVAVSSVLDSIGDTPLVPVEGIYCKLEYLNPSGSIKARIAKFMVERAEREGLLKPGDTIVEASSGNTGNALSMVAAVKGYTMLVVMPEGMSSERAVISRAFGAEVLEVGHFHVNEALAKAKKLGRQDGFFCPSQFESEWNVEENRVWLGPEILSQLPEGTVPDALVMGVGTGGTLVGVGQAFRAVNPDVKIFAVEPDESCTILCGETGKHAIEGISDGFVPGIFERHGGLVDGVFSVMSKESIEAMRCLAREHGMFVGPSSGAHLVVARRVREEHPELKTVVTLFCDEGEKYIADHFRKPGEERCNEVAVAQVGEARASGPRVNDRGEPRKEISAMAVNDNPGILLYTRLFRSPYFYGSRQHGVQKYSVYNHHYHPRYYRDPVEEYWQLLEGVTLWDVGGAERQVEITGPDAFEFTNMLTPRNLNKCAVGQCKYAFITNAEGGIINDPVLLRLDENHFWLSLADSDVLLWAQGLAYNMRLNVEVREPDVGPMQVQGPKSREVMTDLFGEEILEVPYYYMVHRELDGMELVISRTGYSGELGYELYLKNASRDGLKLWDRMLQAGEPHGISPIGPCHIRRIEGGILALGCDMWYDTNPYEVGMGYPWMVDLEQASDFIGKDALARIKAEGPKRMLVGVELGGPGLGSYNDGSMIDLLPVHHGGTQVGKVTSACYSPRLDKSIGFAMVPVEYSEIGIELEIERPEETVPAVVADRVFFKPEHAEQDLSAM